ncbi:hypothetical protein KBA84_05710 [Patescibacteria group bacterium]|nr:hypothetical protein [Patescibacteria group bacterium]
MNHHVGSAARLNLRTTVDQPRATRNNINHNPRAYRNILTLHLTIETGSINAMITA